MPSEKLTPTSPEVAAFFSKASAELKLETPLPLPKDVFEFGDNTRLSNELLSLAIAGKKTGTTSWPIPNPLHWGVGDYSCILDGDGKPSAVMRTVEFIRCKFSEVTEDMARDEGEDDGTLESWRREHKRYYARQNEAEEFSEDVVVLYERFEIVYPQKHKE